MNISISRVDLYNKMAKLVTQYYYFYEKYVVGGNERDMQLFYKLYGKLEACADFAGFEINSVVINKIPCDICYCAESKEYIVFMPGKAYETIGFKEFDRAKLYKSAEASCSTVEKAPRSRKQVNEDITMLAQRSKTGQEPFGNGRKLKELAAYYAPLIKQLDEKQKKIVKMRLSGKTHAEIAEEMKYAESYVRNLYSSALKQISVLTEQEYAKE